MDCDTKKLMKTGATIFKALGHPSRIYMIDHIARKDCCVCEFVNLLDIDKSTVSKHLAILKKAGIITTVKKGKNQICSLRMRCIVTMLNCTRDLLNNKTCCQPATTMNDYLTNSTGEI